MQDTSHHPEQVQLLSVVQADLLHGHTHPVEVELVVEQRVSESACLLMLQRSAGVNTRKPTRELLYFPMNKISLRSESKSD